MANNYNVNINGQDNTQRAFESFKRNIADSSKKMASMTVKMAKAGVAMGAAVGAAGIALTKASMSSLDALAKTADKIGATTEALAGLQHAGELTGVSTNTMNMALQRMTRRVSEAANGTGEAVKALDELGINAVELEKLPLDVQMAIIADKMKDVGMQSDRVRLAMKLFDSEGVALVNTLANGSEGLEAMAAEADALGLSMSRVDTAQVEAANDAVSRAGGVFKGLGNQFAVSFSPIIQAAADSFRQAALDSAEFGNIGQRVAQALVAAFGKVRDIFHNTYGVMLQLSLASKQIQLAVVEFGSSISPVFQEIIDLYNKMADSFIGRKLGLEKITTTAAESFSKMTSQVNDDIQLLEDKLSDFFNTPMPSEGLQKSFDELVAKNRETAESVAANSPARTLVAEASESTQQMKNEFSKQAEAQRSLVEFEKKTQLEKTQFGLQQASKLTAGLAKENKAAFMANKAFMIAEAIINTQAGATKALASFPPPFNYIVAAATVAAGMANVAQIRSQSFEGGGFTGVGARAGGLDGKGGFMAMVHPNETVIDHTKQNARQSSPVNVSFSINANDTRGFDELLTRRRGQIISMINQAMNDQGKPALI